MMWPPLFRCIACIGVLIVSQLAPVFAQIKTTEPPSSLHPNSRWIPATWDDLSGVYDDNPREVLSAWLASCTVSQGAWRKACHELAQLKNADSEVIRMWMMAHLQPYRVMPLESSTTPPEGLLTGYYEPVLKARRQRDEVFRYPVYRPPAELSTRPWLTRQEIDMAFDDLSPSPIKRALADRVIAYLAKPLEVLALQIQGSGQLDLLDTVRSDDLESVPSRRIRLAYAASNNQPYKSVGAWLREAHGVRELSWSAIEAWALANPQHLNTLLWSNPRVVFFREMAASPEGPRGAQGVPLTAGRSIAVDPKSIPYGTPVWMVSSGASIQLKRLVIAQDTGAAITGAVRADYYVGTGEQAGEVAGKLKQGLQMWVLWPK